MQDLLASHFFPLFAGVTFVAAVLLFEGLYLLWDSYAGPEAKKITQRLGAASRTRDGGVGSAELRGRVRRTARLEHSLFSSRHFHYFRRLSTESGLQWPVSKLAGWTVTCAIAAFALTLLFGASIGPSLGLAIAAGAALMPLLYMRWKRGARMRMLEQQLPDALDLIRRALRAGHSVTAGVKMIADEMVDPIAGEFGIVHDEINFGVSLQKALGNMCERIPSSDLHFFVIAVLIQAETGGNLAEVLDGLCSLIRSRSKFRQKIKVLSAEGRISAWTLGLLPFGLAAVMYLGNPDFIRVLWTDPGGIVLTQVTLAIMAVGVFWLWRLIQIRV